MKYLLLAAGLLLALGAKAQGLVVPKATPAAIVEQQVQAYNARNLNAFLAPYADSVEIYLFPHKLVSKGKEAMRQRYSLLFSKTPGLHCEITSRLVQGTTVIDQERVTGVGSKPLTAIAIYQLEGGRIGKVYFVD